MQEKKQLWLTSQISTAWNNRAKTGAALLDGINRLWTLTVLFILWGSAYIIYQCAYELGHRGRAIMACALFVLGLMWLVRNLRSRVVVE
jgi:hypothetical protein